MNKFYKEYEMLSAYIDGELTDEEIKNVEEKLVGSKDLQQKLDELKRVKELTQSSFQKTAESSYFETKLIASLNSENPSRLNIKKWIPALGFSLAAIVLMLFLKSNPQFFNTIIEEQKTKITGLYIENLKPLFITAGLSNEDIFNFALYRKLPLDKERGQYLLLGSNVDGSEFIEIKTASLSTPNNDYQKFISALNLNDKQKIKIDSILSSYAEEMQTQVLVNENNTVAISPKLWNYNKAIFADVMAFAKDANQVQFAKIAPVEFSKMNKPQLIQIANVVKTASASDYIFLTPDTIFVEAFKFDRQKFDKDMKQMQIELKKNLKDAEKQMRQQNFVFNIDSNVIKWKSKGAGAKNFEVMFDSNFCRVSVPHVNIDLSDVSFPNFDALEAQIESATKNIQSFTINIPKEGNIKRKFEFRVDVGDSSNKFRYDIDIPNFKIPIPPNTILRDSALYKNNEAYRFKADSLSNLIQQWVDDSLIFNQKDFQLQMKEFQKEMKRFREEMLRLQNNLQKEPTKIKTEETIEI